MSLEFTIFGNDIDSSSRVLSSELEKLGWRLIEMPKGAEEIAYSYFDNDVDTEESLITVIEQSKSSELKLISPYERNEKIEIRACSHDSIDYWGWFFQALKVIFLNVNAPVFYDDNEVVRDSVMVSDSNEELDVLISDYKSELIKSKEEIESLVKEFEKPFPNKKLP